MNGILIIDKPSGFTSFDVIAVLRGILKTKKIGHSGTLDPMATGVLPVFIGSATKAIDLLPCHDKEYIADFSLGITTDTGDITGKTLSQNECAVEAIAITSVTKLLQGELLQTPPMYSAVKINGQKLYDLARQGRTVERTPKKINVYKNELLSFDEKSQKGQLLVKCSKGTYIRTLIEDMGHTLKTGAIMTSLRRTGACGFTLDGAVTVDEARAVQLDGLKCKILPVESAFVSCDAVNITESQSARFQNGGFLSADRTDEDFNTDILRIFCNNNFIGLGINDKETEQINVLKVFNFEKYVCE